MGDEAMNDKIPAEFDWVKARGECSLREMFERLRSVAERNIAARKKLDGWPAMEITLSDGVSGDQFSVFSSGSELDSEGVRFYLRLDCIEVAPHGAATAPVKARVALTRQGECKLKVGGEELYPWQLLQMTLEPVLFRR